MKILMVCLGNICRSPLAEGILENKIKEKKLNWTVDSAGTGSWHVGEKPDYRSIKTAKKFGITIENQRARVLRKADLDEFDWIFAMDSQNQRDILALCQTQEQRNKVQLLLSFSNPSLGLNVPDPYYDDQAFEPVYYLLNNACNHLIQKLTSPIVQHSNNAVTFV